MKRGGPLKRKSPLRSDPAKQREWQNRSRSGLQRGRLNPIGRKARREKAAVEAFREEVKRRALGRCQAPLSAFVGDRRVVIPHAHVSEPHDGAHAHHLWPGDRAAGRHDPERGVYLCWAAHDWIHHGSPADAHALGLLRPED